MLFQLIENVNHSRRADHAFQRTVELQFVIGVHVSWNVLPTQPIVMAELLATSTTVRKCLVRALPVRIVKTATNASGQTWSLYQRKVDVIPWRTSIRRLTIVIFYHWLGYPLVQIKKNSNWKSWSKQNFLVSTIVEITLHAGAVSEISVMLTNAN